MVEQDSVHEIKTKLDIVELVSTYLPLKRAGINYIGLCPFHEEKTPSFTVSSERQSFKCFGCGKGGDIFSFIMEREGLTFVEALQLLAQRAGVTLPQQSDRQVRETSLKQRLFNLNETLTDFWHLLLMKHSKAATARDYLLRKRGLTVNTLEKWRIGYAPSVLATNDHLKQKGFTTAEAVKAGEPARFAGRIIFPIADVTGRTVGFTGRQLPLPEHDLKPAVGPKYWNTPETLLFKKSEALYGLHLAKDAIRKENTAIIAEGQMDVIGFHQVGLTNCVASSGTALTDIQVRIIARFAEELVFAFDADQAGQTATERGLSTALAAGLNPTIITLPDKTDPAELARTKPQQLILSMSHRQPIIAWLLAQAVNEFGTAQPQAKKRIANKVLPWIAQITDVVEQRGWLDLLSEKIDIPTETLAKSMTSQNNTGSAASIKKNTAEPPSTSTAPPSFEPNVLLIGLLAQHPSLIETVPSIEQLVANTVWQPIIDWLLKKETALTREAENRLNEAILTAQHEYDTADLKSLAAECQQLVERVRVAHNENLKTRLTAQIKEAEAANDQEALSLLLKQLQSDIIE